MKNNIWKIITIITATITLILICVVIALTVQSRVTADTDDGMAAIEERPQDIISIISSIHYNLRICLPASKL